jgi:hypothetical protein
MIKSQKVRSTNGVTGLGATDIARQMKIGRSTVYIMSLLRNERRSEIERKIFWARMSGEIARKRSSATLRTISPGRRRTGYF